MDRNCPNCARQTPEGADFCPHCGRVVSQEDAPRQVQQTASATMVPTEQMPGPPPTRQQSVFTPPQAPPSGIPGGGGRRKVLVLGGLAVAAVLGFVALLVVGAVLYFFIFAPEPAPETQPEPTPQSEPQPEPQPEPEPNSEPAPGGGPLDELVQQQVGNFALQGSAEWPEATQSGATQALAMEYVASDGTPLTHHLAAYGSPEAADQSLRAGVDGLVSAGFQEVKEIPLEGEEGQFGTAVLLQGEIEGTAHSAVLWTNGNLDARAIGPGEAAVDFFSAPPPY